MTETTGQHILVVTADAEDPDPDLYEYDVECPGVADDCRRYEDCLATADEVAALQSAADNGSEAVAHGRKHLHIDGMWMAATDLCYVATHDGMPDAVAGRFEPGRHPITWDVGDGTELIVFAPDGAVSGRG